jgi:hypothetical protein
MTQAAMQAVAFAVQMIVQRASDGYARQGGLTDRQGAVVMHDAESTRARAD